MKKAHLFTGLITFILFIISGQYMFRILELQTWDFNVQRMMYRASHIYILWAGCLNIMLGCYLAFSNRKYIRYMQLTGSLAIIFSQAVLITAFCLEPTTRDVNRDLTRYGIALMLLGVSISFFSVMISKLNLSKIEGRISPSNRTKSRWLVSLRSLF